MKRKIGIISVSIVATLAAVVLALFIWIQIRPETAKGYAARYTACAALGLKVKMPADTSSLKETWFSMKEKFSRDSIRIYSNVLKSLYGSDDKRVVEMVRGLKKGELSLSVSLSSHRDIYITDYKGKFSKEMNFWNRSLSRKKGDTYNYLHHEIEYYCSPLNVSFRTFCVGESVYGRRKIFRGDISRAKLKEDKLALIQEMKAYNKEVRRLKGNALLDLRKCRKARPLYRKYYQNDIIIASLEHVSFMNESGEVGSFWVTTYTPRWKTPESVRRYNARMRARRKPMDISPRFFIYNSDAKDFLDENFAEDLKWHIRDIAFNEK